MQCTRRTRVYRFIHTNALIGLLVYMASCSFSHSFLFALTFSHAYASSQDDMVDEGHSPRVRHYVVVVVVLRWHFIPNIRIYLYIWPCEWVGVWLWGVGGCFKCACMRCSCLQCFYIECWLYKTTEQEKLIIQKRHRQTATETVDPTRWGDQLVGGWWGKVCQGELHAKKIFI